MKILIKIGQLIKSPLMIFVFLNNRNIVRFSDEKFLKIRYRATFHKKLDLNKPKTFNEKLQWLKLHDRKKIYTTMVDKHRVKEYVANIIGKQYIIPTLGVYNEFDEINFEKLPNKFVIKCTHDSGGLVICNDKEKLDTDYARKKITKSLKTNYYPLGREWPYKEVKPRIIVEKYMIDSKSKELRDYKFFCFNGKVKCFKIDFDRFSNHRANYYDKSGQLLEFGETMFKPDYTRNLSMPINLNEMIKLAEKLSKNIAFLRVDFYEIDNKIYFGELTFFPASGFGKFTDKKWDYKLGEMIDLNGVKENEK